MTRDEIISRNPIADFVRNRGHELKPAGDNFVTSGCPVTQHKRGHRPVMIYPPTHSWSCHDCKVGGSVIDWVMHEKNVSVSDAMLELRGRNGEVKKTQPRIVATYDYLETNSNLVSQTVRYEPGFEPGCKKDFRQRRPDGKGDWIWNLEGVETVLFRLPEITKDIREGLPVFLCEGEKDVLAMVEHGFAATCNPMGAQKWRDSYSETLRGADVTIIADKDQDGRKHGQLVASKLYGIARFVRVIELPDVNGRSVKDAYDYFAAGGDVSQLQKLVDNASEWKPEVGPESLGKAEATAEPPLSSQERGDGEWATDLSSLTSLDEARFPAPLEEDAYYGLAGKIVRRILPESRVHRSRFGRLYLHCAWR